jgi:uncharacterized protein
MELMTVVEIALATVALFGHVALWIGVYNRLHATGLSCRTVGFIEKGIYLVFLAAPAVWLWARFGHGVSLLEPSEAGDFWPLWAYAALCWIVALGPGLLWLVRPDAANPPEVVRSNHSQHVDVAAELRAPLLAGGAARRLGALPGNQVLTLEVNHKTLRLPGLPPELDGLTITHLSDLHFTGQIAREYFEYAIEQANRLDGDLAAVTGDIVDTAACIPWIPETLGRLQSRHGVYGVLGNHDKLIRDVDQLRRVLEESGVTLLGGRWIERNIRGVRVVLAGNELPWFGPAADLGDCPPVEEAFRVLLAHTPDQFRWAQENGIGLMLAGHNHGGQIRLPLIGPIVAPSRYGVKYASGVFREGPTVLHVTRGLGAEHPLRFNCPPELTRLVLRR